MSGIAQLLLKQGNVVSGSDIKESKILDTLRNMGAHIFAGHDAGHLQGAQTVIYSTAIHEDNPEIQEAKKQGVLLLRRAEALAGLMQDKSVITVTGSHGKTTTTSLVSSMLLGAGLTPTVAIGGIFKNIDNNATLGRGDYFVAEADESDGTFLYYRPKYSIITNIDREHLDYYGNFDNELKAFAEFISQTSPQGCLFSCYDDAYLRNLVNDYKYKCVQFGLSESADIHPKDIKLQGLGSEFDCVYKDKFLDRFYLRLGGRHNITNALAVIALGIELGIGLGHIKKALADFLGTRRRSDVRFDNDNYLLIDDYAHHPTEIKATLSAVRPLRKRVIAVFQPHRYTRTKLLLEEFGLCFDLADEVIITDIYPANEKPIPGINARLIVEIIRKYNPRKNVLFLEKDQICAHVLGMLKPADLVITLGAGDIVKVCDELAEKLKTKSSEECPAKKIYQF